MKLLALPLMLCMISTVNGMNRNHSEVNWDHHCDMLMRLNDGMITLVVNQLELGTTCLSLEQLRGNDPETFTHLVHHAKDKSYPLFKATKALLTPYGFITHDGVSERKCALIRCIIK